MHVAIIPARSGSKGVPHKNMRPLWGHSLIAWAVLCAREAGVFSDIILSTDSPLYAEEGERFGCRVPYLRPAALAADTTAMKDVLLELLQNVPGADQWESLTLLQPTTPLRTPALLKQSLDACLSDPNSDGSMTVSEVPLHFHALKQRGVSEAGYLGCIHEAGHQVTRRQGLPPTYIPTGAAYVFRPSFVQTTEQLLTGRIKAVMTEPTVNIDTVEDLEQLITLESEGQLPTWAEFLLQPILPM